MYNIRGSYKDLDIFNMSNVQSVFEIWQAIIMINIKM